MHPTPYLEREAWVLERLEWIKRLDEFDDREYRNHGTGLLIRPPDPRDVDMASLPRMPEAIAAAGPAADLVSDFRGPVLNQGPIGSCVSHAMAHWMMVAQWREEHQARVFDAPRVHTETGPIGQGRFPTDILKYTQERGMPLVGSDNRYRIFSYAFAQPSGWYETIKGSITLGRPVMICYMLPQQYGWESGGAMTQNYHENVVLGYDDNHPGGPSLLMLNSWGPGWGRNGLGWVPISFLMQNGMQQSLCQAHTVVDEVSIQPPPPPPPSKRIVVTAVAEGGQAPSIQVGQTLVIGNVNATLKITSVKTEGQDEPAPKGDLLVGVTRTPGGVLVSAKDQKTGRHVTATVSAVIDGVVITMFRPVTQAAPDGSLTSPATFFIRPGITGQMTVKAVTSFGTSGETTLQL